MSVTIVLADDHDVVRQGLRLLLDKQHDFHVVAETADGLAAFNLVKALRPHVLVADLMMPGLSGLELTRQVQQQTPDTRVVILSIYADESYVLEALQNGAAAYVLKGSHPDSLLRGIREVAAGRRYLSPPLSERAIETYLQQGKHAMLAPYEALTTREREVLQLAAEGRTTGEIATQLGISSRTVERHRASLMRKLDLHGQADLIRYALRRGILPLES